MRRGPANSGLPPTPEIAAVHPSVTPSAGDSSPSRYRLCPGTLRSAAVGAALKESVDAGVVAELAHRFSAVDGMFDATTFVERSTPMLDDLELMARVQLIARELWRALGERDPADSIACVVRVARDEPPVDGWAAWPLAAVLELFGPARPEQALDAMEHVTKRMSCEFAVRPLLRDHFEATSARLVEFTAHEDERVRRLPSEGTRPRLPWGTRVQRLLDDPQAGLELLQRLRHDPSETVRRSVANHLNDVSTTHPDLVIETLATWSDEPETDHRMVRHALRTLVKRGHPAALRLLGHTTEPEVEVERFTVSPGVVEMGTHITLQAELRSSSTQPQRLVIDFIVHHVRASGAASPKVFKWTTVELEPGGRRSLTKRRLVRQASTRRYHAGTHLVELQVGGQVMATSAFEVRIVGRQR